MSVRIAQARLTRRWLAALAVVVALASSIPPALCGGEILTNNRAVGGVMINAEGVLNNLEPSVRAELRDFRQAALAQISTDLNQPVKLRMISLRRLEEALQKQAQSLMPLTDEMKYLAGLQRVQYVFVYPEQKDIVLAGPGEGWKVDDFGTVVGVTTGQPVLLLDDLLVALRAANGARHGGLTCSIDPTPEGLTKLQSFLASQTKMNPAVLPGMEKTLGPQNITVTGVPDTSHFAQVMVAADYRMKRIAMHFDKAPVRGLPSYWELMPASSRRIELPRWWLAPNYEPLHKDPDGLAWDLRGPGVKALTEEQFLTDAGEKRKTDAKNNSPAQRWADAMTEKYPELAVKDSIFGQLRNCMDLAIIGALIAKEDLAAKAGFSMPYLLNDRELMLDQYNPPKQVASKASVLRKGSNYLISASGGVQIQPWEVVQNVEDSQALAPVREQARKEAANWWWN